MFLSFVRDLVHKLGHDMVLLTWTAVVFQLQHAFVNSVLSLSLPQFQYVTNGISQLHKGTVVHKSFKKLKVIGAAEAHTFKVSLKLVYKYTSVGAIVVAEVTISCSVFMPF